MDEEQPLTSGALHALDEGIDGALRPKSLGEFIGQKRVCEQLSLVLAGKMKPNEATELKALFME